MNDDQDLDDWDDFDQPREPPGEWAERGLCATHPEPELWFPERGAATEPAKAICRACPVQQECLTHALVNAERFGIWGGKSERERRRLRKAANPNGHRGAA